MTAPHRFRLSRLGAALALSALALPALAQDPPTRAGRIAYLAGAVSFSPAGSDDWAQAPLNRPLVAGDRLWTEPGARDEAQFGPAIARMDGGTLLGVLADDEGATQLQLSQGRIDLHVRRVGPGESVEIDTPNLAFVARTPGDYRITVAPDGGSTDVAVLRGAGDVYGDGNAYGLRAGEGYRFAGQDLDTLGAVTIQPYDDFDRWALARDARLDRAQAARFVASDVVGYEDLDDNGAWRVVPDYGTVWVPTRVAADWAPYHSGHWAWVDPWGWTWVDDQPWGYAVSHYGRWANIEGRWAWVPSPPRERPVYAPALVAFVGAALAWGDSGGEGPGVGWFPLGPREPYRPAYYASPAYVTRINVSNTAFRPRMLERDLRDAGAVRYANRGVPGAMMAMPAARFAQAAPVGRAARTLPPRLALSLPLMAAPAARPLPHSRIGTPPARGVPPGGAQQRVAVAHGMPHGLASGMSRGMPHGLRMAAGQAGGPGVVERGAGFRPQAGGASIRMLRPAPAIRSGLPPPHGEGRPQFAGRHAQGAPGAPTPAMHGGRPGALPPASAPYPVLGQGLAGRYPVHGQGLAGPGPHWSGAGPGAEGAPLEQGRRFEHTRAAAAGGALPSMLASRADAAGAAHAMGRSSMQDMRAGAPEPQAARAEHGFGHAGRPAPMGAPAAPHPEPVHPQPVHAQPMHAQPMHAQPAPRLEAPHPGAPRWAAPAAHMPPHMQAPAAAQHPQPAPQPHQQPHQQPPPPPHQPPPAPPHQQPQPAPHPQAAAPQPEPAHAPPAQVQPQPHGGGHEGGKEHGHGH